jgi:hypothetical protein
MRHLLIAAATIGWIASAQAAEPLSGEQRALAGWVGAAMFSADRCPKTELIIENIGANLKDANVAPEQSTGDEWKAALAHSNAQYQQDIAKDAVGFCSRMWKALGDDPMSVKHPLLRKSGT